VTYKKQADYCVAAGLMQVRDYSKYKCETIPKRGTFITESLTM